THVDVAVPGFAIPVAIAVPALTVPIAVARRARGVVIGRGKQNRAHMFGGARTHRDIDGYGVNPGHAPTNASISSARMSPHAATIFLSAFLLFLVQPVIAKQILPWFGGSAAVWATCLVFFQSVLLA